VTGFSTCESFLCEQRTNTSPKGHFVSISIAALKGPLFHNDPNISKSTLDERKMANG